MQSAGNRLKDSLDVLHYVVVPKPWQSIVMLIEPTITDGIVLAFRMLAAIDFNDEAAFAADKINDVGTDWLLANKFASAEQAGSQTTPQFAFSIRRLPSQSPRARRGNNLRSTHMATPPHPAGFAGRPLPAGGER